MRFVSLRCLLVLLTAVTGRPQYLPHVPNVPKALLPPEGQTLIMHLIGRGKQVYVCQDVNNIFKWKLKGPDAKLFDEHDVLAGRHFEGPSWEANDGSSVVGKVVTSLPSPDRTSVSFLLLTAASHGGSGVMTTVQSIQRLETKGGAAPGLGCTNANENAQVAIPYEAGYYFYGKPAGAQ